MLERDDVVRAVADLVEGLERGRGGVLFVTGEAGLGKTAVLDRACKQASGRARVGFARGDAMESALPFGLMAQMTEDLGGPSLFGEESGRGSPDGTRAAKLHRLLRWLRETAGQSPVLLAFDDLHWSDLDSLGLLSFVARRVADVPLGVVATLRPWPPGAETVALGLAETGLASVERLRPLCAEATAELVAARAGRRPSPDEVAEVWEATAGNPLLVELAAVILGEGGSLGAVDHRSGSGPVSAARGLLVRRFADLPETGMAFARAASVLSRRFRPDVASALAHLDDAEAEEALKALGRAGLVRPAGPGLAELSYPLLAQALCDDLGPLVRDQLHARAFRLLVDRGLEGEAVEHAILGNLAGDPDAVRTVTSAGVAALRAGAVATAIRTLERAVALAGEHAPDALLMVKGEALLAGGRLARAVTMYERVLDGRPLSPAYASAARRMLGRALFLSGNAVGGQARLEEAAALAPDDTRAVRTLLDLSRAAWLTSGPAGALPPAAQARRAAEGADEASRLESDAAWGFVAFIGGDPAGLEAAAEAGRAAAADVRSVLRDLAWHWGTLRNAGRAAKYAERFDEAEAAFAEMFDRAERAASPHAMSSLAAHQADTLVRRGRMGEATRLAEQAVGLTDLAPMTAAFAHAVEALLLLHADRPQACEEACARAERAAAAQGQWLPLMRVRSVRAQLAADAGHLDRACELYAELETETARLGIGEPCLVAWHRHAVATVAAAGRVPDAERIAAAVERSSRDLPCRWPRIAAAAGAAALAEAAGDPVAAGEHLRDALALHRRTDLPLEQAETLLHLGGLLRRSGRAVDARAPLSEALGVAERAGSPWLTRRARDELAVAGGKRRPKESPDTFTPQEQRVAAMAAAGRSCREIAGHLSLSPRTIETHLRRIYRKLGVHSQRELMALATAGSVADRPEPRPDR